MHGIPPRGGSLAAGGSHRVIMLVDMNAFFAQVEQICNPALRGKPVLVGGNPKKRTIVAAASYEARPYGIRSGMSYYEALRLCPHAVIVEGNTSKYLDYCYRLNDIFREFTDIVEAFSIDESFLDLTYSGRMSGGPEETALRLKQRLYETLHIKCSVGIGPNKLIAKMASGWQKPDGLTRIWPEDLPHILWNLPVDGLPGVGRRMKPRLGALGIRTIGDLANYNAAILKRKFGIYGELLNQWANGIDDTPVDPGAFSTAKSMGHSYTLPHDTDDPELIEWFLFWLSDRVARRMRRDGYAGRTISITVRNSDFLSFSRSTTIPRPTSSGHTLRDIALGLFRDHAPPGVSVRLLGVTASNLQRESPLQLTLDGESRHRRALDAMDSVKDKYGDSAITFATLTGKPQKLVRKKIGMFLTNREKDRPDSPLNFNTPDNGHPPGGAFHA